MIVPFRSLRPGDKFKIDDDEFVRLEAGEANAAHIRNKRMVVVDPSIMVEIAPYDSDSPVILH